MHSLDSLRAIMMLLGLVLHSALTYNVTVHGDAWSLKDPQSTTLFSDSIVFLIHSFRMPIFFLVAGFFGAMLFYERQPIEMIKNRISRIVYPFIVFLFVLWPIIIFAFGYTGAVFSLKENPLTIALEPFSNITAFLPQTTSHLWFLYYLTYITATSILLGLLLKKAEKLTRWITRYFNLLIQRPIMRILFFSVLTFLILTILGTSMIDASVSLIPQLKPFVFFLFFYLVGWILFKSKHLLESIVRYDWTCTILAIITATIQGLLIKNLNLEPNSNSWILIFLSSITVWLFTFGITGLFIRYGSNYSARMRYMSDSSYWVYLIHLPLTAIIPAFIWKLPFPAIVKFLIVLSLTTFICFVSYHYLVRNTFIGKFLNGKKNIQKKLMNP
ncbi:acyltransferase family protein [Flavobacterium sp. ZB4P13]|uniref:acyltransferase family protein n=1 Tax=Flavobacterium sp. ZB4P13 TaxID=3401728 RepID=UPI003AAC36F1